MEELARGLTLGSSDIPSSLLMLSGAMTCLLLSIYLRLPISMEPFTSTDSIESLETSNNAHIRLLRLALLCPQLFLLAALHPKSHETGYTVRGDVFHPSYTQVHTRAQPQGLGKMPTSVLQAGFLETGYWHLSRMWEEGTTPHDSVLANSSLAGCPLYARKIFSSHGV